MRGKATQYIDCPLMPRIIPAHAGKRVGAAHAHTRYGGSSPLMRGKAWGGKMAVAPYGIIPAHAGKSDSRCRTSCSREDHPRSCGEKPSARSPAVSVLGSSPLMRGKDTRDAVAVPERGIIPAHAGKSRQQQPGNAPGWDHPRSCGEKPLMLLMCSLLLGSSPLMRGKVSVVPAPPLPFRIIPAHAGKSATSSASPVMW